MARPSNFDSKVLLLRSADLSDTQSSPLTAKLELVEAPPFNTPLVEQEGQTSWRGFTKLTANAKSERRSPAFLVNDALKTKCVLSTFKGSLAVQRCANGPYDDDTSP
jgi:hypothetical protein